MTTPVPRRKPPPDQAQRDAATAERDRNVIVNAGAGTGKTSILVSRFVEMVAPANPGPGARAVPISRVAAITFTRKAAGELRLRIRERLLSELAGAPTHSPREGELRDAIAGLDTAYVGTIHSFADRLLRLRPVEASLSPSYEIAEDDELLIHETFQVLLQAVDSGTLAAELEGDAAAARAEEATRTILNALSAGLKADTQEFGWGFKHGLDALVAGFIRQRDVPPPPDTPPAPLDLEAFRRAADEFIAAAAPVVAGPPGATWIARTAETLARLRSENEPTALYRDLTRQLDRAPKNPTKRDTYGGDPVAWAVWKLYENGDRKIGRPALCKELQAPLHRWMATQLVRLFPVVVALYERVKARHRQLDQLDLLLKLRQLLARPGEVRGEFQKMFDHIFVDEFQDTDPLQAEIVLFLCEREPRAERWEDVDLANGKLTVVGDAKQSIYRFRRADVAMYDRVLSVVQKSAPLEVRLSANFRSVPPLIEWFNDRFSRILKESPKDFDPETGRVFHQPLAAGREVPSSRPVHVLPLDFPADVEKPKVDHYRDLEGQALSRYLRWLTETDEVPILDPLDGQPRRVRFGDVAILAISTWSLPLLFRRLDGEGIPYASRGGVLFLKDPLHRQFLLGLRAVADRDDGVAMAALLRPPFFAVDPADLLREKAATKAGVAPTGESALRAREARDLLMDLRMRRFERPPGATARDLLERTAFARNVASRPNGTQRLGRLRELCLLLEQKASEEGLDYDAATLRLRSWVDDPVQLDPPRPVGTDAVQVITVHQAKGLEFPVVVLWDGKGQWNLRVQSAPWRRERDGSGWVMDLDGLKWEEPEPAGHGIRDKELEYQKAERERVVYVAATRARDLLVVPKAGTVAPDKVVCGALLADAPAHLVHEVPPYISGHEPDWARKKGSRAKPAPADGARVEREVSEWWSPLAAEAARPRFRPTSVSGESHAAPLDETEEAILAEPIKRREGRFGALFGTTVHHAIGLVLRESTLPVEEAVRRAADRFGLQDHLPECVADVTRAIESLRAEGLLRPLGPDLQVEYPVAAAWEGGQLLGGYIDLVSDGAESLDVVDFKTDSPPEGPVASVYPAYAAQVRAYGRLLDMSAALGSRNLRCGLLFTADGGMRWI